MVVAWFGLSQRNALNLYCVGDIYGGNTENLLIIAEGYNAVDVFVELFS